MGFVSIKLLPSFEKFKASLNRLLETLGSTTAHYIHCIKPNDGKQPFVFARTLRRTRAAVMLQKTLRTVLARRSYLRVRQAVITIHAFARGMFCRRLYQQNAACFSLGCCTFFLIPNIIFAIRLTKNFCPIHNRLISAGSEETSHIPRITALKL
ncbi:uncharacterized protein [Ciconia boyciana]|uniref:uncharacterized protein n=1 Tax=Ciconia boyciana TaxID=52775 RepID=UPI003BA18F2F